MAEKARAAAQAAVEDAGRRREVEAKQRERQAAGVAERQQREVARLVDVGVKKGMRKERQEAKKQAVALVGTGQQRQSPSTSANSSASTATESLDCYPRGQKWAISHFL